MSQNININNYFDKIYVLCMSNEVERKERIISRFKKFDIKFEFFKAVNGYSSQCRNEWDVYNNRPISTSLEVSHNKKFIESPGAWGYLKTLIMVMEESMTNKYKRVLFFDNDVILHNDFPNKFSNFINNISENWKIILLGASEYGDQKEANKYYFPDKLKTCGSFAVGIDSSVFYDVWKESKSMHTAFDHLPLGNIYENYRGSCFVCYPNIAIADVRSSSIREPRDMVNHSKRMNWDLKYFSIENEEIKKFDNQSHLKKFLEFSLRAKKNIFVDSNNLIQEFKKSNEFETYKEPLIDFIIDCINKEFNLCDLNDKEFLEYSNNFLEFCYTNKINFNYFLNNNSIIKKIIEEKKKRGLKLNISFFSLSYEEVIDSYENILNQYRILLSSFEVFKNTICVDEPNKCLDETSSLSHIENKKTEDSIHSKFKFYCSNVKKSNIFYIRILEIMREYGYYKELLDLEFMLRNKFKNDQQFQELLNVFHIYRKVSTVQDLELDMLIREFIKETFS